MVSGRIYVANLYYGLGCSDPAESVFEALSEDPDREMLSRLLISWRSVFGSSPAMVRDAINQSEINHTENQELKEILYDIADERGVINRRKLGWWIKRHSGRIVDNMRFIRGGSNGPADKWRVDLVSSVSSVSSVSIYTNNENVKAAEAYSRASSGG